MSTINLCHVLRRTVYSILPILILQYNWLPAQQSGLCIGFIILENPSTVNDHPDGVLAYQITHCKQWYRSCGLYWLLCLFPILRLRYECEAYAAQIKTYQDPMLEEHQYLTALEQLQLEYIPKISFMQKKLCLNIYLDRLEPQLLL